MKRILSRALSLLLLVGSTGPGSAGVLAEDNGVQGTVELRGTVIDETKAYIVAAKLTLDNGKGKKIETQSDERGHYRFIVQPGVYTLIVEVEGFAKFTEEVDLTEKRQVTVDPLLKVEISENVEVKDNAATISTEPDKNASAITLTEKDLEALPDDPDELLETLKQMAGAGGGNDDAAIYVGGFRERGQLPPKEAILRININQNPYSAEHSEPGSFRIEIITKPGADTFHGGFNLSFNDESLNARDAFASFKAPYQNRRYGGFFSGPIIRNRWGFFFDMQRTEIDGNQYVAAIVLDPITFLPTPFSTTILTPSRSTNFSIRSDYLASKQHTIGVQFRHSENDTLRGGGSAFTLPERSTNSSFNEDTLRLSLTTIATEHAVNEMRIQLSRRDNKSRAISDDVAINVLDAFNGGGSQVLTSSSNKNLDFTDTVTYTRGSHTFKMGFRSEAVQPTSLNRSNFGGTFTFGQDFERNAQGIPILGPDGAPIPISPIELYSRVVQEIPGYRPSQFSINSGDPFIGLSQWEYGWFAQDDWKVSDRIFFSYGVRHEFQTHLQDRLNFAPRFSVAWNPDKARKSTIRGGGGIFYTYVNEGITSDVIRFDGEHQQQLVIRNPNFFEVIPPDIGDSQTPVLPTTRRKASGLNDPYTIVGSVSYERQLPLKLIGSIEYKWTRGVHLLRSRNINAPIGILDGAPVVPFPGDGPILDYESTGLSTRNEMRINVRTGFGQRITVFGNYTLASTRSDTDGANSNPANPYDLSIEWGPSGGDVRHNFFLGTVYTAPWGIRVSPFLRASTGHPFNITTGRDNNGDNQFTDRPAFADPGDPGAVVTPFGTFNPTPLLGDVIIPRNFGRGPGFFSVNLGLSKTFGFGPAPNNFGGVAANRGNREGNGTRAQNPRAGNGGPNRGGGPRGFGGGGPGIVRGGGGGGPVMFGGGGNVRHRYNLTLSLNAIDIFNHVNFGQPNGVLTSPLFGIPNSTLGQRGGGGSRRIDLGLRFNF